MKFNKSKKNKYYYILQSNNKVLHSSRTKIFRIVRESQSQCQFVFSQRQLRRESSSELISFSINLMFPKRISLLTFLTNGFQVLYDFNYPNIVFFEHLVI